MLVEMEKIASGKLNDLKTTFKSFMCDAQRFIRQSDALLKSSEDGEDGYTLIYLAEELGVWTDTLKKLSFGDGDLLSWLKTKAVKPALPSAVTNVPGSEITNLDVASSLVINNCPTPHITEIRTLSQDSGNDTTTGPVDFFGPIKKNRLKNTDCVPPVKEVLAATTLTLPVASPTVPKVLSELARLKLKFKEDQQLKKVLQEDTSSISNLSSNGYEAEDARSRSNTRSTGDSFNGVLQDTQHFGPDVQVHEKDGETTSIIFTQLQEIGAVKLTNHKDQFTMFKSSPSTREGSTIASGSAVSQSGSISNEPNSAPSGQSPMSKFNKRNNPRFKYFAI